MSIITSQSVSEFVLCADSGIHLLGQVQATFMYYNPTEMERAQSSEIKCWWRREKKAYQTVMTRLQKSAKGLGATAIVHVQWLHQKREWDKAGIELTATGTAVTMPDVPTEELPYLCTLSIQEILKLRQSGFMPVGYAIGGCAYYQIAHQRIQSVISTGWGKQPRNTPNLERTDFTRGYQIARNQALQRMHESIQKLNADGIIGIHLISDHQIKRSDGIFVRITAGGTVIRAADATFSPSPCPIQYALPLSSLGGNTHA